MNASVSSACAEMKSFSFALDGIMDDDQGEGKEKEGKAKTEEKDQDQGGDRNSL